MQASVFHSEFTGEMWPWFRSRKEFLKGPTSHAAPSRKFKRVPSKDKGQALSVKWLYCSNSTSFFKHKHLSKRASRMLLQIFFFSAWKYNHQYLSGPALWKFPLALTASARRSFTKSRDRLFMRVRISPGCHVSLTEAWRISPLTEDKTKTKDRSEWRMNLDPPSTTTNNLLPWTDFAHQPRSDGKTQAPWWSLDW